MQLKKFRQMIITQVSIKGGKIINVENFCIFQFLNKCLILVLDRRITRHTSPTSVLVAFNPEGNEQLANSN